MAATVVVDGGERVAGEAGAEMPLERLEAEICELAGHLAAGECRWLLLLSEFDRREGWTGWGLHSCAHWVSFRCGIGLQAAREKRRGALPHRRGSRPATGDLPAACLRRHRRRHIESASGTPLDVGRKRRTPPPRLRRALRRRDGGCRFPGCGRRRFLHAHHIVHWINGGETKLVNMVLLCSHHHRLVHEGGYRIESLGDHVFVFFDRAGRVVPEVPPGILADGPDLVECNGAVGLAIDPETCRSLGGGEPYDLGLAIEALVAHPGVVQVPAA